MRPHFFILLPVGGLITAACGSNDIEGTRLANADMNAESKLLSLNLGGEGCGVDIPNLDDAFLAALPDCGRGAGKCVPPNKKVSKAIADQLEPCDGGGSCIPMQFLKANTEPLKKCTSFGKAEGVCVKRIVPTVEKLTFLPQDSCAPDERCTPCSNPLSGKVTGICDIGKPATKPADQCKQEPGPKAKCPHEGPPVLDVTKLTPCGQSGMHCLPKDVVPDEFVDLVGPCSDPSSLCVPDKFIAANGQLIPKTCTSIGASEGRCLHQEIPQVAQLARFLPADTCEAEERCVPCYDPLTGDKLPSCTVACDTGPTQPALVFTKCEKDLGRCVPKAAVPADMQKNLKTSDCKKDEELCAPVRVMDRNAKPQMCELKYAGIPRPGKPAVCIEDVLTIGVTLNQSDCPENFKCTPCYNPLEGGAATNLPGCPK